MLTERTQVLLTRDQRARLERLAKREGRSVGALIRDAIEGYTAPRSHSRSDALQRLFSVGAPVDEWPAMKAQIQGAASGAPPALVRDQGTKR